MQSPIRLESTLGDRDRALRPRTVIENVVFAGVYVATARAGLMLDAVSGFATPVWAPSGLSLAALVLFGYRLWPGVAVGAFVANALTGAPTGVALGIAAGNTLEALLGAGLLRRVDGFTRCLDRVRDALALIVFAAMLSTTVSATIGIASLYAGGLLVPGTATETWRTWWVGDLVGDLFVAPMLLIWIGPIPTLPRGRRLAEAIGVGVASVVAASVVFGPGAAAQPLMVTHAYVFFPVLIWAALRFGQRGAVSSAFLVSTIAVWGTALGHGPFARGLIHERLLALQIFMGVAAATFLVLGAASDERGRATAQLERALSDAKESRDIAAAANQAKTDFLAVMSHELRTPLNAIFGFTDLLKMEVHGKLNDKQRSAIERIQRNQVSLLSLIDDVLSFAKAENSPLALDIQTVRLGDVLDAVESSIEPEAQRKSITVTRDLTNQSLSVRADPLRLQQIVQNVVGNAIKFTPNGGAVTVVAQRDDDMVRISVRDTGIGISPEQLPRVFEPFFQAEKRSTRVHGGVGLGLTIARDLARRMHGDVGIESRLGQGSTVWILIPAA
jgi:signal transduction histidine kinase